MQTVKRILDWLVYFKINRFHWHLTDYQGWRVEIEQYPRLTEVGGHREGSQRRSFKGPGSELFGLTVGRVGETDLELIQQDTSPVTIELGTPVRFEDGQHVE